MRQPVPFGKYLLLDRISVGGMAEVFKAKSYGVEGFEKVIAIKRILPSMGEDADFIKMFIDEAKIAGQLSHANICQIFELGKIDGSHFIAMEYIWGKDLLQIQNRVKRRKTTVPVLMACYVIAKACEGLHYSHKRRDPMGSPLEIVHRDASPQNLLVSYEGEVKVIDFGIARAASRSSRTQAGVLKGKFGYMSPEQVRGLPLDRRSDIFSLGTVLYETLTGERLFVGESDFSTLERVRNADVTPPSELNSQVPPEVERIVMRALSRDRDKRYQWCSEMQADLQAYLTAQDEVVSNKGLGEAVRALFATELEREKDAMERYKHLGRDGLISGVPQARADLDVVAELGEAGPLEGDPTILGGPDFEGIFESVDNAAPTQRPIAAGKSDAIKIDKSAYSSDFEDEAATAIFDEGAPGMAPMPMAATGGPRPMGRASTAGGQQQQAGGQAAAALSPRGFGPGPGPPPAPTKPSQIGADGRPSMPVGTPHGPRTGPGAPGPGHRSGPMPHLRPGQPPPSGPHGMHPSGQVAYPRAAVPTYPTQPRYQHAQHAAQLVSIPRQQGRRGSSRAVRDIAIGVGIAAIVLTLFAVGRFLLAGGDDPEPAAAEAQGKIEVSLTGAKVADVTVDGDDAGKVEGGAPLLVPATLGDREVVVSVAGEEPCTQTVSVTDKEPAKVECSVAGETLGDIDAQTTIDGGVVATTVDAAAAGVAATADAGAMAVPKDPVPTDPDAAAQRAELELRRLKAREKAAKEKAARDKADKTDKAESEKATENVEVGYLVANSTPFAGVRVDGRKTGKMTPMTASEKIALKPGRHTVTFVVGKKKYRFSVKIEAGKTRRFYRVLKDKPKEDDEEDD